MKTYFIIAGEASGDMHGAGLIKALKKQEPEARFVGMGGEKMQEAGCVLLQDYQNMAFMGVVAVLGNLGHIRENFRIAQQGLLETKPDALVLIDYPSFNLKIAAYCRQHLPSTPIYYYIPPKIWAWKSWRVHKIGKLCDQVLGIFPFEPAFYARYGYHAQYVGNPTMDAIRDFETQTNEPIETQPCIAILPGSRRREIAKCLPKMLEAAQKIEGYNIVIAGAPEIERSFYEQYAPQPNIVFGQTYEWVKRAKVAIVNSGTATLETALLRCPQVAVYHAPCPKWAWGLRKYIFKIPYFTLPNIVAGKTVIQELIGPFFTAEAVEKEARRLLTDETYRQQMLQAYQEIRDILGDQPAAQTAAQWIITQPKKH